VAHAGIQSAELTLALSMTLEDRLRQIDKLTIDALRRNCDEELEHNSEK
jgi:hypothetical protein